MSKGDCYEVHAKFIVHMALKGLFDDPEVYMTLYRLCHGNVTGLKGDVKGKRFGHGWIEVGDAYVIDLSNGNNIFAPKEAYYQVGNIKEEEVVRYDVHEARVKMLETEHFGPWHGSTNTKQVNGETR